MLDDGSSWPVHGKVALHPIDSLSLPSSFYVYNFPFNLLYVSQLTKSLRCNIIFTPSSCIFQDPETKKTISSRHEKNGLYYLDHVGFVSLGLFALTTTISHLQLHFRLGYSSLAKLKKHIPLLSLVFKLECEAYHLGKHHCRHPILYH